MARGSALSPWGYGPRRRRSPRLVLIWMGIFLFILYMTWWISSRRRETDAYDRMLKARAEEGVEQ